jgi:hypothetical protein
MSSPSPDVNSPSSDTVYNSSTVSTSARESPDADTNPTSISIAESAAPSELEPTKDAEEDITEEEINNRRRSGRSRTAVSTYNDTIKSGTGVHIRKTYRNERDFQLAVEARGTNAEDGTPRRTPAKRKRHSMPYQQTPFRVNSQTLQMALDQEESSTGLGSHAFRLVSSASNVLGKRTRDVFDSVKEKVQPLGRLRSKTKQLEVEEAPVKKRLRLTSARAREVEVEEPEPIEETPKKEKKKIWLDAGLYVGQERDNNPRQKTVKRKSDVDSERERKYLPMPMFSGARILEKGRDFVLPFDVLNPLPKIQAPKNWSNLSRNRYIEKAGNIAKQFKKADLDAPSHCTCTVDTGCDDNCLNRNMRYECNSKNCRLSPEECKNRGFAELKWRKQNKNSYRNAEKKESNLWGDGIEVMATGDRGHGVRAMRSFEPGQIICEYTGEVITQDEADRRMNEDYKDQTVSTFI